MTNAILTPDRLLLPIAPWILVVRACRAASLNEDEPTIEEAPPVDAAADADAVAAADVEAAARCWPAPSPSCCCSMSRQ